MKKLLLLILCITTFASTSFSQTGYGGEKGVSSIGVFAGYAIDSKAALVGVDYRYNILDRIRIAPSVSYMLKDSVGIWYVNADAHYLARLTEKFTIYPIGGLGLSIRKTDSIPTINIDDLGEETIIKTAPETKIRLGFNIGFGAEMRVTRDLILGAEFKYHLTDKRIYNQAMFLARAAYYF
ncbi:MAG: outer membrane beta-barrel protein [Tannerella sp.]|jgi:opacity protein-like surface antigen|nr:outer membrane beta-barrel protein [Tannerella sp.]